ncbi:MAG: polysaccharide deacetylase family protein [Flavobacteriales bacterium]|nr:polysaccharide deacetylase family protein [Flavobacteriales bacterium]
MPLLVHIERPSPRVRYVVQHVLERMLGLDVQYIQDAEEFRQTTGPRLSYSTDRFANAFHIPCSGACDALPPGDPEVTAKDGRPAMFLVQGEEDLFAGIFYLLSLTDELRGVERDEHGRIPSSAMFSVRKGFADRPWVDERVMELGRLLEATWPGEVECAVRYHNTVTVDMDNILRYAGRPLARAIGAGLKDLLRGEWTAVAERWRVRRRTRRDPFERAVDVVSDQHDKFNRVIFFFLMRGGTRHDHAADHTHPTTRDLIQRAATVGEVGIHPSYGSRDDHDMMEEQRVALQRIVGRPVVSTRQHFLRWELPRTLGAIERMPGYHHDHTLGFTDRAGFRVGTCTPFPWYDLGREKETRLMLHPFAVMDSALIEKQGMGADAVERTMHVMSDLVRAVNGQFVSVWHDRYLSGHREFAPWPKVFERVMNHARP